MFLGGNVAAPIHQAYRQALAQEPVLDAAGTKRQLELEMEERIVTLAEKKQALEERKTRMPAGQIRLSGV